MIHPNWKESLPQTQLLIGGRKIGEVQSIKAKIERDEEPMRIGASDYSDTVSLNAKHIAYPDITKLMQPFNLVHELYNYPRKRLPKKKRIRNKWRKKYLVGTTTYMNCVVTNYAAMD